MRRAFTLIELLVVVVVLATLMAIVFRIAGIGANADNWTRTVGRMQKLENCLSGYYAAFGSYPPVKLHGTRDIYSRVGSHGIQIDERNESIWGWDPDTFVKWIESGKDKRYRQPAEESAWRQVRAACISQPVACRFPFPTGYSELITAISDEMRDRASSGDEDYKEYWENENTRAKLIATFDDGGSGSGSTGRFSKNKDKVDWQEIQLFKFGLMSFLLPRYLVMMNGNQDFFTGGFRQWDANNVIPCDPFTGATYNNWGQVKNYSESTRQSDLARIANIPSQAVCARWMPNLEGACHCNHHFSLFGIDIWSGNESELSVKNINIEIFSPKKESGSAYEDQYILDCVSMRDGWWHDIYYYSPEPYQTYTVWSAGPNGRTFPPWISRDSLSPEANRCVAVWTVDDIIHMSN